MTKHRYEINVHASHAVSVEADSLEEAEERAMDAFIDQYDDWDLCDLDIIHEESL